MFESREIEAFLTVGEELHFGRAADRLGLSTSRISSLVRTFERRAGTPLFERTSRRVRLTASGEFLFRELRPAVVRIEGALAEVRATATGSGQVLRVGFAGSLPAHVAGELVAAFEQQYPGCRVVRSGHPTTDLFRWLGRDWPVDLFVTWMPLASVPQVPDLGIGDALLRVPRAVALGAAHPLAGRATVDLVELLDYEVIYPDLPGWYGDLWVPATAAGRRMKLRPLATNYVEQVLRLVAEQPLVHLTFTSLLDAYPDPAVRLVELTGVPPMPVRPVWPVTGDSTLARLFARVAAEYALAAGWLTSPSHAASDHVA